MRRPVCSLTLLIVTAVAVGVIQPAAAAPPPPTTTTQPSGNAAAARPLPGTHPDDQPPRGATDGIPVGGDDIPHGHISTPAITPNATPNAVTQRYFGSGPWTAIGTDASSATKCAGLSTNELKAMMVAPVFGESSGGTTASSAPAPMTLSRYDEWSGTYATNSNFNANYGLYAFRDPYTAYKRIFWHPGVGIWQYDSAGVGADFTAAEVMNVSVVAADVGSGMVDRWCNPGPWIGTKTTYTATQRRAAAWEPWWYTDNGVCPACEQAYQDMNPDSATAFANIHQVSMSTTGGAVLRSCRLGGTGYPCWYIDPKVAQGSSWWASLTPLDGGSPTVAPTPITTPFYVIKRDGLEQRYWLKADTGYATDLSGIRALGKNARPRSSQPGSGITWSVGSGLCDVSARRGSCDPNVPPAGVATTPETVSGTYKTVAIDANGDGKGDIFFYGAGGAANYLWLGGGSGTFRSVRVSVAGGGDQVVAADLDGDGKDDLVCYDSTTGTVNVWRSLGDGSFVSTSYPGPKAATVHSLDVGGKGQDSLLFYGVGSRPDSLWQWRNGAPAITSESVNGNYQVLIGDVDGNHTDDVVWYAPGAAVDYVWLNSAAGTVVSKRLVVNGTYRPAIGDLDGDGRSDIVWYATGSTPDFVWFGANGGQFVSRPLAVAGDYQPVIVDLPHDGRKDVMWFAAGSAADQWSRWSSSRAVTTGPASLAGTQAPVVGAFSAAGGDGIFWYGKGSVSDSVWWQ